MALPRASRVKRAADFQRVFREGKTIRGAFLFIKYLPRSGGNPRASVVVARNASSGSVERNHIRRILGELIQGSIGILGPCDVLLVVQRNPGSDEQLTHEAVALLRELATREPAAT